MSLQLNEKVKYHLELSNTHVHNILNCFDSFKSTNNYYAVANTTFLFFQNQVHETLESIIKKNPLLIKHCCSVFDDSFFEDCSFDACKNVSIKIQSDISFFIFNLCQVYEHYVSNEFFGFITTQEFKSRTFVCCCSSIVLFCQIKIHYPVPQFDYITQGMPINTNNHISINDSLNGSLSSVLLNHKPGLKDIYTNESFQKSIVFTQEIVPMSAIQSEPAIQECEQNDIELQFKMIKPTKNYSNPLINEIFVLLDNMTFHFDNFCKSVNQLHFNEDIVLQDLTTSFYKTIKENQSCNFDIGDFIRNNYNDELIIQCEQTGSIIFSGTYNGRLELSMFNQFVSTLTRKYFSSGSNNFHELKSLFEKIVLYAFFIFKKRSSLKHNRGVDLAWIHKSVYFQPHLHCANDRITRQIKGSKTVGMVDALTNFVIKKSKVVLDGVVSFDKTINYSMDDMNLETFKIYDENSSLKDMFTQTKNTVSCILDKLEACVIDLRKQLEHTFKDHKQSIEKTIFLILPMITSKMGDTLKNIHITSIENNQILNLIEPLQSDNPSAYFDELSNCEMQSIRESFHAIYVKVFSILCSIPGTTFLSNKINTKAKTLCACSMVLYFTILNANSSIKLICDLEGSLYNSRYHIVSGQEHYDQMIHKTVYFGFYEPNNGEVLLKSRVELK